MNKIQQVVLNLLNNAYDAIQEAGTPAEFESAPSQKVDDDPRVQR